MLPPATKRVWAFLHQRRELKNFVLMGGSALALRIRHRVSEDLDIAFPEHVLPRPRLEMLVKNAVKAGFHFERNDDESALREFASGGGDLHDYQQDFIVNQKVKVSFFAPDAGLLKVLSFQPCERIRIATLAELFRSKCLVSARRSKTRDWLDLYILFGKKGFTMQDYQQAFERANAATQMDIGLARLCSGKPQADDEGYEHLLQKAPSIETMKRFFVRLRDRFEVRQAAEVLKRPERQK